MIFSKVNKVKTLSTFSVISLDVSAKNGEESTGSPTALKLNQTSFLIYDGVDYYKGSPNDIVEGDYLLGAVYGSASLNRVVVFKDVQFADGMEFYQTK